MADSYFITPLTRKTADIEPEIKKLARRSKSTPIRRASSLNNHMIINVAMIVGLLPLKTIDHFFKTYCIFFTNNFYDTLIIFC